MITVREIEREGRERMKETEKKKESEKKREREIVERTKDRQQWQDTRVIFYLVFLRWFI
jgi:hypothetical protein